MLCLRVYNAQRAENDVNLIGERTVGRGLYCTNKNESSMVDWQSLAYCTNLENWQPLIAAREFKSHIYLHRILQQLLIRLYDKKDSSMPIPTDDLEVMFKEQIDYFFNCGPRRLERDTYYSISRLVILTFRSPLNDGDVELQITYNYHTKRIIFDIVVNFDDRQTKSSYWVSNIPESEEEYFQESTVKDLFFSYEFYQYLEHMLRKE